MKIATLSKLALASSLYLPSQAAPKADFALQAGYHVIYSYPGLDPPAHLYDLIKLGKVGGIILFGENVSFATDAVANIANVTQSFQDAYAQSIGSPTTPLLIMTDQEGGIVRRLPGGPDFTAKEMGASVHPILAAIQGGEAAAQALKAGNCNTNLAPVLDVYREEGNFIDSIGRSFGNSSWLVAECATSYLLTQQLAGSIATAKHFPGLGAAVAGDNTDIAPVTIDLSKDDLRSIDMSPYIAAIASGIDMVMTSWALYPSIDPRYPAGMSKTIVQDELRGRLRFQGVTITDALEAGAIAQFGDAGTRGVQAALAGMDILLASERNVTQGEAVYDALVAALNSKTLPQADFEQATERILNLRKKVVK
ncbi:hypothetical protein V490_08131 [Pseudogymnoascus sp. VKM F-3557]|nr:hypothetical protein V490_08131 [Pseudogymnoascus sp. VKM F-3557]